MPQYSRPVFNVDFSGLADAASWPSEYFKQTQATTGASFTVASGVGLIDNGTVASFGAQTQVRLWGYPVEGDKFEILAKLKIISTGNTTWLEIFYRSTNDPNDTRYAVNFSDVQYRIDKRTAFTGSTLVSATQSLATNSVVWLRLRVWGNKHQVRTWTDGTVEPQAWNLTVIDASNPQIGKVFLNSGASDGSHRQIGVLAVHVREIGDPYEPVLAGASTATFSGNGSTSAFTVTHGLDGTPSTVLLTPQSDAATAAHRVSAKTSTTFTVTFTGGPPPSGTSNVVFDWRAEV
jgi:hypothetical protein